MAKRTMLLLLVLAGADMQTRAASPDV